MNKTQVCMSPFRIVAVRRLLGFALLGLVLLCGCAEEGPVVAEFEPNWVFAYNVGQRSEQPMDLAMSQTQQALQDLFGTPDEPKLPEFVSEDDEYASLISMDHLIKASGPADASERGLFRKHCVTCHGVTGNGRGPTAALVDPYPRDFRLGRFKFKSTPIGTKPTKQDISYLIQHGITGTTMVKIPELTDADIEALVDYVIYLSWRGEVERSLLFEAGELDFTDSENPESLYDPSLKNGSEEQKELFADQWDLLQEFVLDVADNWLEAPDEVKDVPERDATVVPDTAEEVLAAMQSSESSPVKESVARGKELFLGEKAACSKCHGKEGKGDGQTDDYDEWAKDWTKKFGVDPTNEEAHIPLIARGALPVRKAIPRNFSEGVFRGGSEPEQLYRRISLGIEGSPMPAAELEPQQIWDLINFVRSLYVPEPDPDAPSQPSGAAGEKVALSSSL